MPKYDGREDPPTDAGDVLIWVPRVLVSPLYLVSEFVLRRPLGWLVTTAEAGDWPTKILDFFTFNEERTVGIVPTAFIDFGFRPSVGFFFFWDNAIAEENDIRLHVATGGTEWLSGTVGDRIWIERPDLSLTLRGQWIRRPDYIFHGLGARSLTNQRARYSADIANVDAAFDLVLWRQSSVRATVGVRDATFRDSPCCDDPSVGERAALGQFPVPPGFADGFTSAHHRFEAALDTRRPRPDAGGGVRVEGMVGQAVEIGDRPPNRWVNYGGSLGGFLDLTGHRRVLGLWVTALFADARGGAEQVPFTEQVVLGGSGPMRGFLEGRLVGRSALVATLQYEWPIWVWLNGSAHVATGNVFGTHLEDFDTRLLRLSSGFGLRTAGKADHILEIMTGFGTETYEEGMEVSSFRLVLGGNRGF